MKTAISSILSLLFCLPCFAQEMENSFYENGQDVGGDALIKSSFVEVKEGKIFKTFKIETSAAEDYYLDAWMVAPATAIGYAEYEFEENYYISKGNQMIIINASIFRNGIYFVHLIIGEESISKTISL